MLSQVLLDEGFRIILPNYVTQPNGYNQVADWDVARGIDFLAIPPDETRLYVVDSKGSVKDQEVQITNGRITDARKLPRNILRYAPMESDEVYHLRVRIPGSAAFRVEQIGPEQRKDKYYLSQRFLLKEEAAESIIRGIKEYRP